MSLTTKIERATREIRYALSARVEKALWAWYFKQPKAKRERIQNNPLLRACLYHGLIKRVFRTHKLKEALDWLDAVEREPPPEREQGVTFIDYDEDYNKMPPTGVTNRLPHWPSTN